MDKREQLNRSAADHLARTRQRLVDGKAELERQRASVDATREHLSGMRRWIEQTEEQLGNERSRRHRVGGNGTDA
jgi:chromosome segregation ATPase